MYRKVQQRLQLSRKAQFATIFVLYSILIVSVIVWSGKLTSRTLYDKYMVTFEGVQLQTGDRQRAAHFYKNVLDFSPIEKPIAGAVETLGFELQENRKLFLSDPKTAPDTNAATGRAGMQIVLRVRNGLEELQQELVRRSKVAAPTIASESQIDQIAPGRVTNIIRRNWGDEFYVKDLDGNTFVFYRSNTRHGSRF